MNEVPGSSRNATGHHAVKTTTEMIAVGGVKLEVQRRGAGPPLLLLPGEDMLETNSAFVETLAQSWEVVMPSPPGFGRSERPDWIASIDDVAYLYLDLLDALKLGPVPMLGVSLGGWIAAEIATKTCAHISKLALIAPYGIKTGTPTEPAIADIWALDAAKVASLKWFDPENGKRDYAAMTDDDLAMIARNNETLVRLCWMPYLHDPQLARRLRRIPVPTLLVWGEQDGIVAPGYGKAYAALIANAELTVVPRAGHYPHLEQPAAALERLNSFLA